MEHEKEENAKGDRLTFTPQSVYYVVMVSNIIVAFLVINLFFIAWFGKRDSHSHLVEVMIKNYVSMQVKIDVLDNKIDDIKRELEELKRKLGQ